MFNASCNEGLEDCYQCFILIWVNIYTILGIPLKLLFIFATHGYALHTKQHLKLKNMDENANQPLLKVSDVNNTKMVTEKTDTYEQDSQY